MFYLLSGLGLWPILLIILLVIVFVKISNLKLRITKLELELRPRVKSLPVSNDTPISSPRPVPIVVPDVENAFVNWLKEDWLQKLGGFLLLIGFGWFATYAFMNDWIGPAGRITLGVILGVIILALGTWRIKKYLNQGGIFLVLGSAVILLTVFAAQEKYDMFIPAIALGIMFLSAAYVALVSVRYDSFAVALSGLILSVAAPLLAGGSNNNVALFSYLLVVVLGIIWIVAIKKNWGSLIFYGLLTVFLYSLPLIVDSSYFGSDGEVILNFAYVFALIFFVASLVNILISKDGGIKSFLSVAVGNGIFLLAWIVAFVPPEWQVMMIALWMIIFAIGAFYLFIKTGVKSVFYVYAGVAVVMLATATGIQFDGPALTFAYTIESFLVPILFYYVTKDLKTSARLSLLLIGPVFLSLENLSNYADSNIVLTKDFFVLALITVVLLSLGFIYRNIKKTEKTLDFIIDNILLIAGSVYVYILLWLSLHIIIAIPATATTFSLIIFTAIGLVKYFYGISVGSRVLRNYGGIFLGLVVLRLLFIDVWGMDMGARIIVFFLVGILLMSTAFIGKKIKSGFVEKA
jgi:uncharacterized membrane protein